MLHGPSRSYASIITLEAFLVFLDRVPFSSFAALLALGLRLVEAVLMPFRATQRRVVPDRVYLAQVRSNSRIAGIERIQSLHLFFDLNLGGVVGLEMIWYLGKLVRMEGQ